LAGDTSALHLFEQSIDRFGKGCELVTVYRGKSMKNRPLLKENVISAHPDLSMEEYYGGQYNCDFYVTFE
jgi:dihydroxyacetone kinase-like predicted kinase